jgi:hypothetical protein
LQVNALGALRGAIRIGPSLLRNVRRRTAPLLDAAEPNREALRGIEGVASLLADTRPRRGGSADVQAAAVRGSQKVGAGRDPPIVTISRIVGAFARMTLVVHRQRCEGASSPLARLAAAP